MKYLGAPQSGSQANTTASRNRYGQYYRTRATPTNPSSAAQGDVRNTLRNASQGWGGLTQGQRDAWAAYALTHPVTDSLGQTMTLTGHSMYVKLYAQSMAVGLTPSATPPADPAFLSGAVTLVATFTGSVMTVSGVDQPSGYLAAIFASPLVTPGVSFPPTTREIAVVAADAWATPITIATAFTSRWGALVAGQKAIIEAQLSSDEAVYGQRIRASAIVGA